MSQKYDSNDGPAIHARNVKHLFVVAGLSRAAKGSDGSAKRISLAVAQLYNC